MTFDEANQQDHPVEEEWHYPLLIKYGFTPETLVAKGFVRCYVWNHSDGHRVIYNIGCNADYWKNPITKDEGYWGTLEDHLKKVTLLTITEISI